MSDTGITTRVLAGHNSPGRKRDEDLAQDDLARKQGYEGLENCLVEHVQPGREVCRELPSALEVSPLTAPRHGSKPYSPSQRPGRPGRVRTGR